MVLKIYDDIITDQQKEEHIWFFGTDGVSFGDINDFISQIPEDDPNIDILIHCKGGVVSEGWAIVDKLRATGKKISATIDGTCASMAVSVLLAASERRAQPHATIHIHKPYYPPYTLADAYNEDDLQRMAEDLKRETEKMLDWYVERTGANREELEALMLEDKDIDMDEAMRLGFISEILAPMSASVRTRNWTQSSNKTDMAKNYSKAGVVNALANLLGVKVKAVDYAVTDVNGNSFDVDIPEGEEFKVGDPASPDGEYTLEDGRVVVIAEGVIAEIKVAEPAPADPVNADPSEPDEEKEALKAENEELKAKVAELEAKIAELEGEKPSEEDKAILTKVNLCGGRDWLEKVAKSNYVPSQRKPASAQTGKLSKNEERLNALKEKKNNK